MNNGTAQSYIAAIQDGSKELPIPSAWRPIFLQVVRSLIAKDFRLEHCPAEVERLNHNDASRIAKSIESYGAHLVELPDETWSTSTCIWTGSHWDVLIDLWTQEEGPSDLVIGGSVLENNGEYTYRVQMVYVP